MKIPSEALVEYLDTVIQKPLGSFRPTEELEMVLRRRLTKKEFKLLLARLRNEPLEELAARLKLDEQRLAELQDRIRHKLNQDRIKRELYKGEE